MIIPFQPLSAYRLTKHAACPKTRGPSFSSDFVGIHPSRMRQLSNSSALGRIGQTETAVSSPNQVIANDSQRDSPGRGTRKS